jgi:hypothetical protein
MWRRSQWLHGLRCAWSWFTWTLRSWVQIPLEAWTYECVSKSFRTGRLEREPQMVQLSVIRCSFIAILWVNVVSLVTITFCVASQRVLLLLISLSTQSGNFWIHQRMSTFFCVVLSCAGRGLAMGRSPIQGDPTKYLNGARFDVFTAVKIQVNVFWIVTLCSVSVGYHPAPPWRWRQQLLPKR